MMWINVVSRTEPPISKYKMNDHNTDVKDKVANLDRRGKREEKSLINGRSGT